MDQTNWDVAVWRDKKVIWWRAFRTEAEALEAAGLRDGSGVSLRTKSGGLKSHLYAWKGEASRRRPTP